MFQFKDKTIYILSPEGWGLMRISKHHYATMLARMGNRVYFVEPPSLKQKVMGRITETSEGVFLVSYKPIARGRRYLGGMLFRWLQALQFRTRVASVTGKPDVVWCFDLTNFDDLGIFGGGIRIFHPVDHNLERKPPPVAANSDFIFSTSPRILEYMKPPGKKGRVVQHGLNADMEQFARRERARLAGMSEPIPFRGVIGFWGSLFKESLDARKMLRLVDAFPEATFILWGAHLPSQTNLNGKVDGESLGFISALRSRPNVELRAPLNPTDLVREIDDVDLFINVEFEYSMRWDNGNPHKIMEYLATGRPVFSTPVLMYSDTGLLFESRDEDIVADMRRFFSEWERWGSLPERLKRIDFALENTYALQISRIEAFISDALGQG